MRAFRILAFFAVLPAAASQAAEPAALYRNTFDDASALAGWEISTGAEGGSVSVENGRLALRGAPFSYRGARVSLPLSAVLGRAGPFSAKQLAASHISWTFNLAHENGPGAAGNVGFLVHPLSTGPDPEAPGARSYVLKGGLFIDDRLAFDQLFTDSDGLARDTRLFSFASESGLRPFPRHGAVRMDFHPNLPYQTNDARWLVRIEDSTTAVDPASQTLAGSRSNEYTVTNGALAESFTHFVIEARNGGTVFIDNLTVTAYAAATDDGRGPSQIIPLPPGFDPLHGSAMVTFGDAPVALPVTASSGRPVTWRVSYGPARIEDGLLHFTGAGSVAVSGQQVGDETYLAAYRQLYVSVAPRPITIRLTNLLQTYAAAPHVAGAESEVPDLAYRFTYDGLENPPRHAGSYAVVAIPADANHAGRAAGTLVVAPAPLHVYPAPVARLVGQPNPSPFPLRYEGFLGPDTPGDIDRPPTALAKATKTSRAGAYPVTLSGGSDNDYRLLPGAGELTILSYSGTYEAILTPPGRPDSAPLGKLNVTLSATGPAFTGTLRLVNETSARPLTGTLGALQPDGSVGGIVLLPILDASSAAQRLALTLAPTTLHATLARVAGDLSLEPIASSEEGAKRLTPPGGAGVSWSGRHTILLHPLADDDSAAGAMPRGPGHSTGSIAGSGVLTLSGRLPDGTQFSLSSAPDEAARHRVFFRPHGNASPNALVGRIDLAPHPVLPGRRHAARDTSFLFWSRSPVLKPKPNSLYPAGYVSLPLSFSLDPWLPPLPAKAATRTTPAQDAITLVGRLGLLGDPASVDLAYPDTADFSPALAPPPAAFTFDARAKPVRPKVNPTQWQIALDPANGTMSGSLILTYPPRPPSAKTSSQKITFSGVLRQPASPDDPLIGAAQFIWTDAFHNLPPASHELLLLRPEPAPAAAP